MKNTKLPGFRNGTYPGLLKVEIRSNLLSTLSPTERQIAERQIAERQGKHPAYSDSFLPESPLMGGVCSRKNQGKK